MERDTLLVTVPRNNSALGNDDSGNRARAPVAIDKQKWKPITNKYERSATTAPQNRELKTGFPTLPMSRTTSKNSSCNKCWEQRDRIFKALEPDGLGKSYSL